MGIQLWFLKRLKMCQIAKKMVARMCELRLIAAKLTSCRGAKSSLCPARVSPTTILEDITVPRSELVKMVRFIQQTADKHQFVGIFGHFGDGNSILHF